MMNKIICFLLVVGVMLGVALSWHGNQMTGTVILITFALPLLISIQKLEDEKMANKKRRY